MHAVSSTSATPRRAPEPGDRQRDAERTRQRIVDAALAEFAEKGYAGIALTAGPTSAAPGHGAQDTYEQR